MNRRIKQLSTCLFSVALAGLLQSAPTVAADTGKAEGANPQALKKAQQRAIQYLKLSQSKDGYWTAPNIPGITALATYALLESGVPADDPVIQKALKFLLSNVRKNGGIYHAQSLHRNYETSITLLALVASNRNGRHDKLIRGAEKFLRGLQWDETEDVKPDDPAYGGAGYGKHQRPDLSNTQFLIEALKAAGVSESDPAMQKALKFVSRCQNLETEHNNTKFAAKVNDGGIYYTPAAGGTSQAGLTPNGGLRSYGSMTYAGLKSMIYAGLNSKDARVSAAFSWIQRFYSVDENPGLGKQGLYYYYHTFAKTLSVLKVEYIVSPGGKRHDWRKDLVETLAKQQRPNGSWINKADRWYEGDPNLVTAYGLLALKYCGSSESPRKTAAR